MLHPANQRVSAGAKVLLSPQAGQERQQLFHLAGSSIHLSGAPLNSEYVPEKRCNTWPKPGKGGESSEKRKEQKFANCFQLRIHLGVESHPVVVGWTSAPMGITVVFLVVLECAGGILGCTGVHHGVCPGVHRWASAEGASPPMNRCTGPGGSSHASNHWPLLPLLGGK